MRHQLQNWLTWYIYRDMEKSKEGMNLGGRMECDFVVREKPKMEKTAAKD